MTWLYVPGTSSPCAQESADLNSESCSLSTVAERMVAGSLTWRGKEQPLPAWSRRWKQGGFIRLLSGLTCSPSTLDRGVASFISSLRETPARTTALPGSVQDRQESGSSLPRSAVSPKSAGLILSSERTCRGTRTDNSRPSSRHWSDWATALRQEYSARPKPEIPCGASDCSSWPSARTSDTNGAGEHGDGGPDLRTVASEWMAPVADDTGTRSSRYAQGGMPLSMQVNNWHAPRANDAEKRGEVAADPRNGLVGQGEHWMAPNVPNGGRSATHAEMVGNTLYHGDKKVQLGLEHQAKAWAAPAARDHKGSSEGSITRQDGKSRADMLDYQAEQFFRLPSYPDQPIAGGSTSSTDGPNTNQPSVKRKLNPIFVEALMRWPTGLSGFERQEMAWTRWWLLMPSFLSMLCSPANDEQPDLFGEAA